MLELPYGIADFRLIREKGMAYVDRTGLIRDVERLGRNLVFLRPRRFGKSLWVQTLATYYDLRLADTFETLFGGLDIGREPTPEHNRYFVLHWNLSTIKPGNVKEIAEELREHVATQAEAFASCYRDQLTEPINITGNPASTLTRILNAVNQTPYRLYLFIDEYDNFVNEVMVSSINTYRALFAESGPFKMLFKSVKSALEGKGLERVFTTGVSPIALNDLTSGFNNAEDITHELALASLCGFKESEVQALLERVADERQFSPARSEELMDVMRTWYNGYRFHDDEEELVYNPTNTLYLLKKLLFQGKLPKRLHDENLRTDSAKLAFIAHSAVGTGIVEELTEGKGEIEVFQLKTSFSADTLVQRLEKDEDTVASFLYYMGLLSLTENPDCLRVPNLVVRQIFLNRLLEIYLSIDGTSEARGVAVRFFRNGDLQPLLGFFEERLFPVLSNRDRPTAPRKNGPSGGGVNEMVIKTLFLSILFEDTRYNAVSEMELERSYADLCLLVRPERRGTGLLDFLFEFKHVRRKELGKKGEELREMHDSTLRKLKPVAKALQDAKAQVRRYRSRLENRHRDLDLHSYAVVAVGLERMLGKEVPDDPPAAIQ